MHGVLNDHSNKKFGKLTAISWLKRKDGEYRGNWLCKCDCGKERLVRADRLLSGSIRSCGCDNYREYEDMTLRTFEKWTVINKINDSNNGRDRFWLCKCKKCNKEKNISSETLKRKGGPLCICQKLTYESFIGKKFGQMLVLKEERRPYTTKTGSRTYNTQFCFCKCICGNEKWVKKIYLAYRQNSVKSCGCLLHSTGINNPHHKEKTYTVEGYVFIHRAGHPNSDKRGKIREHVWVMSEYLGRPITKEETIHHKNGIKDDNRLENLELWTNKHPGGQKVEDLVEYAHYILDKYKDYKNPSTVEDIKVVKINHVTT